MAEDQFNTGSANWWDSSRNRFDQSVGSSSSSSSGLNNVTLGSFGWETEMVDIKARSNSMESAASVVFQDKLHDSSSAADHHHHLQMMGLGLSSQPVEWNQSLLRGDKAESSFRSILQDNMNANIGSSSSSSSSSSQVLWRDSSINEFKQINNNNRGFFIDHSQFSPHGSSSDSTVTNFQMDNSTNNMYGSPSATMFQGFLGSDQQNHPSLSYNQYGAASSYVMNPNNDQLLASSTWPRPVPQFLRTSPPKPQSQLQFSNNAPFWNPAANMRTDVRSSFMPTLQTQIHTPNFDDKPKNISAAKRSESDQPASKRSRNETASSSPAIKVRKEKMGDRIAALQQLVSPFGKTDAASVLSEAIEYIKFLHEQVTVLSTPYMKSGTSLQHQQSCEKSSKDPDGPRQDLRSRGLCLVPVSSTFPVTHETTGDFWTPTFGGTFR